MKTMVKMLKVKIVSLAAEARIIRREERRSLGRRKARAKRRDMGRGFPEPDPDYSVFIGRDADLYSRLRDHRLTAVRREQRLSLLAYAFLRGRAYAAAEPKAAAPPDWARVAKLVEKFGTVDDRARAAQAAALTAWAAAAVPATR